MDLQVISSQVIVHPPLNSQQPIKILRGSVNNFKGVPEPGDYYNRPLMVSAWTQTNGQDFSIMHELILRDFQSEREKKLEEKIKVLEEDLKAHTELLSQIHATSARTSALLQQQQTQNHGNISNGFHNNITNIINNHNEDLNNSNIIHTNNNNHFNNTTPASTLNTTRSTQSSPKIVNAINTTQHVISTPTESVNYRIIAEGAGNSSEEPIEIQLAEEDGALNLNSSADSGRLEICLAPEENIEIKTECNTNNTMETQHSVTTNLSEPTTSSDHQHFIKKRKLAAGQLVSSTTILNKDNEQLSVELLNTNMPQQTPNEKRRHSSKSLLKTPKIQIKNFRDCVDSLAMPTTQSTNGNYCSPLSDTFLDLENVMVSLGPNNTHIPAKVYENINWTSASIATRKLLMAVFDRNVLATHSMTGKPSPAFKDHGKPVKQMLDPLVIADIIYAVTQKCNVSDKEVRSAITTKCADENKMMKLQMNKRTPMREINKENIIGQH